MKAKLTDNLFLKVLSVVVAIVLWLVVVNISDAEKTMKFSKEVMLLNTEVITDNGKVFRVEEGTNIVRLTVRARQSVIRDLKETDFILTADMEKNLKFNSLVGINVECRNRDIIVDEDVSLSRSNVVVSIEDAATEQFQIQVNNAGTKPSDGLVIGSMVPEQTVLKVTGPVSTIEKIRKVEAVVDVTGLPGTTVKNCVLKFYDAADNEIDTTYLNYVGKNDGIDVTVSLLNKKTIPLLFSYSGTPAENYQVSSVKWKPEYIEIAGTASVLKGITSIQIPPEAVSVEGADEEVQQVVDITPYLPSGIILPESETSSILVIVELEYVEPTEEEEEQETTGKPEKPQQSQKPEQTEKPQDEKPTETPNQSGTAGQQTEQKPDGGTDNSKDETAADTQKPSGNTTESKPDTNGGTSSNGTTGGTQNDHVTESGKNDKTENNH